jgi:hypothetical protein
MHICAIEDSTGKCGGRGGAELHFVAGGFRSCLAHVWDATCSRGPLTLEEKAEQNVCPLSDRTLQAHGRSGPQQSSHVIPEPSLLTDLYGQRAVRLELFVRSCVVFCQSAQIMSAMKFAAFRFLAADYSLHQARKTARETAKFGQFTVPRSYRQCSCLLL